MKKLMLLIGLLMVGTNTLATTSSSEIDNLVKDGTLTRIDTNIFLINGTEDFLNYKSVYLHFYAEGYIINFLLDCQNIRSKAFRATNDGENWTNLTGKTSEWRSFDFESPISKTFEIACPK